MNDKENTQASVPELPDLSYYPSKKQRDEAAGWFERNRARVLAAQAAGKQPMPVDIASIGLMREQIWAAYRASIRAMCALKECGLGGSALCQELEAIAKRLDEISHLEGFAVQMYL